MTVAVAALVAAGAGAAVVAATGREPPTLPAAANRLPAVTLDAYLTHRPLAAGAACPATKPPPGGAALPRAVRRQLGASRYAFGSPPIWVVLQPVPPVRLRSGHIYLKLALVVSGSGTVRIVGKPLDGGPGRLWSDVSSGVQPGPPHVVVTSITVSHPGCWDVAAVFRGNAVQWVYNAVPRSN